MSFSKPKLELKDNFMLFSVVEGVKRLLLSAEVTWGRVLEGVAPSHWGGLGGLTRGILEILIKIGALWCNLGPLLHKIKHHLTKKELHGL